MNLVGYLKRAKMRIRICYSTSPYRLVNCFWTFRSYVVYPNSVPNVVRERPFPENKLEVENTAPLEALAVIYQPTRLNIAEYSNIQQYLCDN